MKNRNFFIILLLSIVFILILYSVFITEDKNDSFSQISLNAYLDNSSQNISLWKSPEGILYLFVPDYIDITKSYFSLNGLNNVILDETSIHDGDSFTAYAAHENHTLNIDGQKYELVIVEMTNSPTLYIKTISGKNDYIFSDKKNKEEISVTLYDKYGKTDYANVYFQDKISGHGNSTWLKQKKPYTLEFHKDTTLLGMAPPHKKYVLISNALDESNMRNKIVYSIASQMNFEWTPKNEYVNVYLNDEYQGLYLLCEKIEIGKNRLNISSNAGVLVNGNQKSKWDNNKGLITENGYEIEITSSHKMTNEELLQIKDKLQKTENVLYAENSTSTQFMDYMDLDSWCRRYLIDEFFLNKDGEIASSYMYWDENLSNGRIYAGPVWDYDIAIANENSSWTDGYCVPDVMLFTEKKWYKELNRNLYFQKAATEVYFTELRPLCLTTCEQTIDAIFEEHKSSFFANEVRWKNILPSTYGSSENAIQHIKNFITERIAFLDQYYTGTAEASPIIEKEVYTYNATELNWKGKTMQFILEYGSILLLSTMAIFIIIFAIIDNRRNGNRNV